MPKQADSTPRNVEFLKDLAEEDNQDKLKLAEEDGNKEDNAEDLTHRNSRGQDIRMTLSRSYQK